MGGSKAKCGLWLVGCHGGVGSTVTVGLEAIRRKLAPPLGLVGETPPFDRLLLAGLDRWVVGGHEVRDTTFLEAARLMHEESRVFSPELLKTIGPWLRQCDRNVRDGTAAHCGRTIGRMVERRPIEAKRSGAAVVERLADDLRDFAKRHGLDRVVVVNVASTEPPYRLGPAHQRWARLEKALARKGNIPLPASSLYALAAIEAGASYVNFTPSTGIDVPALLERAEGRGIGYMGCDGKTGETLMKSVLAPMFAARNLQVLSWVGHNIFGNRDGLVLDDPRNKSAKMRSKDHLVHEILGYHPQTLVSIEYIESLRDWKTAWDHIHFAGFLGTKMSLQFIWEGCDSILAAPLVIELARFAERAARAGMTGPLTHLACFFKSPMGVREHSFARQYETLLDYAVSQAKSKRNRR